MPELEPIGRVESPLSDRASAPKQGDEGAPDAWLVLEPAILEALDGIRPGDRIVVLTWLHQARRDVLRVHPRGDPANPMRGVFATRSPDRPNPVGLHEVEVAAIDGERVLVRGLEAVDGTPVVDLKPVLRPRAERDPARDGSRDAGALDALVGDWSVQGALPADATEAVHGRAAFEWLDGGPFVVQRWTVERPEFPDGIAIIAPGAVAGTFVQHYFDSRGVARVYEMTLDGGVWRLWRAGEDFWQRFAGTFSADGTTIEGAWETSDDGSRWEHDFALTYTKRR